MADSISFLLAQAREHLAYDEFWQEQALDKIIAKFRSRCPSCGSRDCGPGGHVGRQPLV